MLVPEVHLAAFGFLVVYTTTSGGVSGCLLRDDLDVDVLRDQRRSDGQEFRQAADGNVAGLTGHSCCTGVVVERLSVMQ